MKEVRVKVHAKINLALNVTGTHTGKHLLDTVMTSVDIADVIVARKAKGITVESDQRLKNAERAAEVFLGRFGLDGAHITVKRGIPSGGGLGGSSADAAGVITALENLYAIRPDNTQRILLAAAVGSDVPFMLEGGYGRLRGVATEVEHFDGATAEILLVGKGAVDTGACFSAFDARGDIGLVADMEELERRLRNGDWLNASRHFNNALAPAAIALNPSIFTALETMRNHGLTASMTGSGCCVFGTGETDKMERARLALAALGYHTAKIKTVQKGCVLV